MDELKELLQKGAKEYNEKLLELKGQFEAEKQAREAIATAIKTAKDEQDKLVKDIEARLIELQKSSKRVDMYGREMPEEVKSAGQLFSASEPFTTNKGRQTGFGNIAMAVKSITGLAASAGALVRPDRDPTVYENPKRMMRIRDLIRVIPTGSNAVEFVRQNVFTNNAGPQQPGTPNTAIGAGELETKPESNITWSLQTANVRTFAHWIPASRQVLSDAPMLQGLIDTELTYGLDLESDNQLLLGDGTNQNVTGILVDAGVSDVAPAAATVALADLGAAYIDHIRKALTTLQTFEYYNINGLVLNPQDWETIENAKGTDGHYLLVPFAATAGQATQVWRIPVVLTNAQPQGTFLMGDWTMGAVLYDREEASIRISEHHADNFVKNAVTILGEERYAFAIPRPKAFAKGTFPTVAP